jgi:hypothetical protein
MLKKLLLLLTASGLLAAKAHAQFSEENIWVVEGAIHDKYHPAITLNYMMGASPDATDLSYRSYRISADAKLFSSTTLWGSLPINTQDGPMGSVTGIGDLMLTLDQELLDISGLGVSVELGTKFATATSNAGDSLADNYQSGTGTNDLLLGLNLGGKNITFGIGYQFIGGRSPNHITELKEGDRFVVRGGYMFRSDKIDFGGELLAIQPMEKATMLNPIEQSKEFIEVAGTDKLQLGLILKGRYSLSEAFGFTGSLGIPIIADKNSMSLSRISLASLGVAVAF